MMIEESEDSKRFKLIPKLFSQPYEVRISGSGLFRLGIAEKEKEKEKEEGLEKRFSNLRLSEKFFYHLMDGLKKDEKLYDERRKKIADSGDAEILKKPLLLIFEHENFKSAKVKTPELYFETYKAIINSKIINNKNFNLATVVSLVKSGRSDSSSKSRQETITNILHSENLEPYDLVYIYFYLQSANFFEIMYAFTDKQNPLLNWLFQSNLTSHLVDYIFQLKNYQSYALVDRIIGGKVAVALSYVSNWEFENGVELLAWFKAYMHYFNIKSLKEYLKKSAFVTYPLLKEKLVSYNISLPKILAMFPNIKNTQFSANPSESASAVLNEENINPATVSLKRKSLTQISSSQKSDNDWLKKRPLRQIKFTQSQISFIQNGSYLEASTEENQAFLGSSLEQKQGSSFRKRSPRSKKNTRLQSKTSFSETVEMQETAMQIPQVFFNYSNIGLQPNINPVLESPQVSGYVYTPISGECADLIETTVTYATPPENADLTQYILSKTDEEIQRRSTPVFSGVSENLMTGKETVASPQTNVIQPVNLYSTQEPEIRLLFGEIGVQKHSHFFNTSANEGAQINLMSSKNQEGNDCMTPLVDLDCESTPRSLFFQSTNLEVENNFVKINPQNYFGN